MAGQAEGNAAAGSRGGSMGRVRVRPARLAMGLLGIVMLAVVALPSAGIAAGRPAKSTASVEYYVSMGDSYSVGYQPLPSPGGATSGYTAYVAKKLKMQLENFGCGGATTASILNVVGCTTPYGPPAATDAVAYPTQTQVAAAEAFLTAHSGQVGLITVSIGGNDVTACAAASNPISCVGTATKAIQTNVTELAGDLRKAAGTGVPIVGLTYPDVLLGEWVYPAFPATSADQTLATESVSAFQDLINPTLKTAYASASGTFVDVTAATGAYTPLSTTANLAPYGKIPKAVVEVCKLTWYCQLGNIHANTKGYTEIGKLITAAFP